MNDREQEKVRYDQRAAKVRSEMDESPLSGASAVIEYLREPYLCYESLISRELDVGSRVLEIGAGTGEFTGAALARGSTVIATDISEHSLRLIAMRHPQFVARLETRCADMESLPFSDSEFDCVLSAGSLSYGDNHRVLAGIWRVLKPGGVFICVDSLNHNPIYKINRWIHFLMGSRSRSTLARIPNFELIGHFRKKFCSVDVRYFGSASWLMPVVGRLIGIQYAAEASKFIDNAVRVRRSAFKFVMVARKGR